MVSFTHEQNSICSQKQLSGHVVGSRPMESVGFSVAGLDRAKFSFYQFQSFLFIVVIVKLILL